MQVSIQTTSGLERRLTIGVPAEQVDTEVNTRLQKASKDVRLPGFRPGKVPLKVVKQRFGEGIRQEVVGEMISKSFQEAVVQEKLAPAGQPSVEPKSTVEGKDLEYVATFEVFPEIELQDYSNIQVEQPVAKVQDSDVDEMLENLRKQQAEWEDVERAAADGDQVNIDYLGTKAGEAFEGGTAQGSNITIGSNSMIPGFEEGIIGMSAGEEKTLSLTFPEDYHAEELKGAAVEFAVTLNKVSAQLLPELTDEFFAKFGITEGGEEAFLSNVRTNMERELDNAIKTKVKDQVMDALLEAHTDMLMPQALVKQEIGALRGQMLQQFGGAVGSLDTESLLPDDMFTAEAERRVKLGLVLNKYITEEKITADTDKVKEKIDALAATYEDSAEAVNFFYSDEQQLQQVQSVVVEDMVVEKLLASATISETACSYQEALAPRAPAAE